MNGSEFTGPSLIAGELVGVREFRVDQDGWLHSLYSEYTWHPEENVAICRSLATAMNSFAQAMSRITETAATLSNNFALLAEGKPILSPLLMAVGVPPNPPHPAASLDCTCGFYAYTLPLPWRPRSDVRGVIAGYGRVTAGSKGFRASHARILALVPPARGMRTPDEARGWLKARSRYGDIPIFDAMDEALEAFPLQGVARRKDTADA